MSELVERLRGFWDCEEVLSEAINLMGDAADKIEGLEATVFLLHNPHTGEECGCPVCNSQRKGGE